MRPDTAALVYLFFSLCMVRGLIPTAIVNCVVKYVGVCKPVRMYRTGLAGTWDEGDEDYDNDQFNQAELPDPGAESLATVCIQ
jgi:hypothetical protein